MTEIISPTMVMAGKISFSGELVIRGTVRGIITTTGDDDKLVIEEGGLVVADITVRTMVVSGLVEANQIKVAHTIRVTKTGKIIGATIQFHTLELEEGAILQDCKLEHKPWPRCGRDGNMGGIFRDVEPISK